MTSICTDHSRMNLSFQETVAGKLRIIIAEFDQSMQRANEYSNYSTTASFILQRHTELVRDRLALRTL